MFEQYLNPKMIIGFLKNNTDFQKLALNIFNSEQAKDFIQTNIGLDYQSLKENLTLAIMNTKKSNFGIKRQEEIEQGQKLQVYKELANTLIKEDGLSVYSAIVLAAGFAGIDQNKVVEFLKAKGYSATKQKIEHYYNTNEGFLKSILKRKGKVIPGWNDAIESGDLDLESENKKNLVQMPSLPIQEELGIDQK